MTAPRVVYVISDLHIGGSYELPDAARGERKRGFRMMTHVEELTSFVEHVAALPGQPEVELVINGDFVDFLAEEKNAGRTIDPGEPPAWTAFRSGRGEALDAFETLANRDGTLFDALRGLLAAGKRLTIVLGNHDLELSIPDVRAALERRLGGGGKLRFLDDGQAHDLGQVLIDHGNLFDPANVVDHDRLRAFRALYSRGWFADLDRVFSPPAGSRLVAEVMNPIKVAYGFIDLLKPESEPLLALLLALEPSYRDQLDDAVRTLLHAARTLVPRLGAPYALRNVAGEDDGAPVATLQDVAGGDGDPSDLDALVSEMLAADPAAAATLRAAGRGGAVAVDVAAGAWWARWSLFRLLLGEGEPGDDLGVRIPQVQATLRVLQKDRSFDRTVENQRYRDAAALLGNCGEDQKGYQAVIFGHTHHAKDLIVPGTGVRYLNTGTWANLMKFPPILTMPGAPYGDVQTALVKLALDLKANKLDEYLHFEPTYVRLSLGDAGELLDARLCTFDVKEDRLDDGD